MSDGVFSRFPLVKQYMFKAVDGIFVQFLAATYRMEFFDIMVVARSVLIANPFAFFVKFFEVFGKVFAAFILNFLRQSRYSLFDFTFFVIIGLVLAVRAKSSALCYI